MKKILAFILLFAVISFAQNWRTLPSAWYNLDHILSSDVNVTLETNGMVQIVGAETFDILIPTKHNLGSISVWGYITNTAGTGTDIIYIEASPYRGDGTIHDTNYTYTWESMQSVNLSALATDSFDISLMSNATLKSDFASYFVVRFRGTATFTRQIWFKIEMAQP